MTTSETPRGRTAREIGEIVYQSARFRYADGTTAQQQVDRHLDQGWRVEQRGMQTWLVAPDGGTEVYLRHRAASQYARYRGGL